MPESIKRNKKGIILMMLSSVCVCTGQLLWKMSTTQSVLIMLMGFVCYGAGALIMLTAYRFGRLSVLQPVLSLNYALSIVLGFLFLNEPVTIQKVTGVFAIMGGVAFIAAGDKE